MLLLKIKLSKNLNVHLKYTSIYVIVKNNPK